MKKFLCILTAAMMLVSAVAIAEGAQPTAAPEEGTVEQKLYDMIPILDSIARNMGIEGEFPYDAANPDFFWTQMYLECVNWGTLNPEITVSDGVMTVPAATLLDYAWASFPGMKALPDIQENIQYAFYDAQSDTYIFKMSDAGVSRITIEKYALDATGALIVGFGLYNSETGERLGGLTAKLVDSADALTLSESGFPYAVESAAREAETDFAGLDVTACAIQYEEENPTPEPTPAPAPSAAAYPVLSKGSKGDDVRALQQRLNELGYDCGSADGIFGSATKGAVRYFQDAIGATQDGVATNAVQQKLFASGAPKFVQYVQLKKNSEGIRVEKLQDRLRALGYLAQPTDGAFGSRTEEAVRVFQKKAGLKVDGIAGEKTLKALFAKNASKCDSYITLKKGDTGYRVNEMQKRLKKLGFLSKKPSSSYDGDTVKAVKAFIAAVGEKGDGKTAGKALIKKLFEYEPAETPTPAPTSTEAPTATPAPTSTEAPTATPAPTSTEAPTATPAPTPTEAPTATPAPTPTDASVLTPAQQQAVTAAINAALAETYDDEAAVNWLQTALSISPTTGVYDQVTFDAVTLLQRDNALAETGIADADVIALLMTP